MSCTPTYVNELILGRRYLLGDLSKQELEDIRQSENDLSTLNGNVEKWDVVTAEKIFRIARDSFENPGALFQDTGCAHSCALIHNGVVVCCMEEIGRHNALDKAVGYALLSGISCEASYNLLVGEFQQIICRKQLMQDFPWWFQELRLQRVLWRVQKTIMSLYLVSFVKMLETFIGKVKLK